MSRRAVQAGLTYSCTILTGVVAGLLILVTIPNQVVSVSGEHLLLQAFLSLLLAVLIATTVKSLAVHSAVSAAVVHTEFTGIPGASFEALRTRHKAAAVARFTEQEIGLLAEFMLRPDEQVQGMTEHVELLPGRTRRTIARNVTLSLPASGSDTKILQPQARPRPRVGVAAQRPLRASVSAAPTIGRPRVLDLDAREAVINEASVVTVAVPVLRQRKGLTVYELGFMLDGASCPVVGHWDSLGTMLTVLDVVFDASYGTAPTKRSKAQQLALDAAATFATDPRPIDAERNVQYQNHRVELDRLAHDVPRASNPEPFLRLSHYLAHNYITLVEVTAPLGARFLVETSYSERRPTDHATTRQKLRVLLGLGYKQYVVALPGAAEPESYTFSCRAPEGCYVSSVGLTLEDVSGPAHVGSLNVRSSASVEDDSSYLRLSPTLGLDLVELHGRHIGVVTRPGSGKQTEPSRKADLGKVLALDLRFREIPPGLLGVVTLLSALLALTCTSVAWRHDQIFTGAIRAPGAATPTTSAVIVGLVFGVPAIMSGWVASRVDAKALRTTSPLVLAQLATLLALTGVAVAVAAFKISVIVQDSSSFDVPGLTVHLQHPTWTLITLLSLTQLTVNIVDFTVRHRRYLYALRKSSQRAVDGG